MLRTIFFLILFLSITAKLCSQVNFPQIPKIVLNKKFTVQQYIPYGNFLTRFPNFNTNGNYSFTPQAFEKFRNDNNGKDNAYFFDLIGEMFLEKERNANRKSLLRNFNNVDFPCIIVPTNQTFKSRAIKAVIAKFSIDVDKNDRFFYTFEQESPFEFEHPKEFGLVNAQLKSYNDFNTSFKAGVQYIFNQKEMQDIHIAEVLEKTNPPFVYNYNTLVFNFEIVECQGFFFAPMKNFFPSYANFKLTVSTLLGDSIQQYGQTIFFEGISTASKFNALSNFPKAIATKVLLPNAFEGLLNQFLNDDNAIKKIAYLNAKLEKKVALANNYTHIIDLKIKYLALKTRRDELSTLMKDAGSILDLLAVSQENRVEDNNAFARQISAQTNGNATAVAAGSILEAMIERAADRATVRENEKKLAVLKPAIEKLKQEQHQFIKEAMSLPNYSDLLEIIHDVNQSDSALAKILNNADNSKKAAFYAIKKTNSNISSSNLNQINLALRSMSQTEVLPQSSAITNEEKTVSKADDCMKKANAEWYLSSEYRQYEISKLNADASLCKAKIIDLTIQYCSSKLSAKEIAEYKRISLEEKQIAKELQNGRFNLKN